MKSIKEVKETLFKSTNKTEQILLIYDFVVIQSIPKNIWELGYDGDLPIGRESDFMKDFIKELPDKYGHLWIAIIFLNTAEKLYLEKNARSIEKHIEVLNEYRAKLIKFCADSFD